MLIDKDKNTLLQRREERELAKFISIPIDRNFHKAKALSKVSAPITFGGIQITSDFVINKWNHEPIFQKLTHQNLEINFWIVNLTESTNLHLKKPDSSLPMPKALQNFRDKFFINWLWFITFECAIENFFYEWHFE